MYAFSLDLFNHKFFFDGIFAKIKKVYTFALANLKVGKRIEIVLWCNGSTIDSGPVSLGSNPSRTTFRSFTYWFVSLFYGVMVAQQILGLFVLVRVRVEQQKTSLLVKVARFFYSL